MRQIKKWKEKANNKMLKASAVATTGLIAAPAFALPDAGTITGEIDKASPIIDAVGGSIVAIVVAMLVFALIIGMLFRKGR